MADFSMMSLIPSAVSAAASFFGQQSANDTNVELAGENRAWQERMSNTAHQREVADLQAAGLNPMLSALRGSGATTPQGNAAHVESATKDSVNSGHTAALLSATIDKLRAEAKAADGQAYAATATGDEKYGFTEPSQTLQTLQSRSGVERSTLSDVHVQTRNNLIQQIENLKSQKELTDREAQLAKQRIGQSSAEELHTVLASLHLDLDLQRARNEAMAQTSWWKQHVSPYLKDAGAVGGTAASVAGGVGLGRMLRPNTGGSAQSISRGAPQGLRPPVPASQVIERRSARGGPYEGPFRRFNPREP